MISREKYKSVRIHIVTFKKNIYTDNEQHRTMTEERRHNKTTPNSKFACPVCSNINNITNNRNPDKSAKVTKLFSKRCELCLETPKFFENNDDIILNNNSLNIKERKAHKKAFYIKETKSIGVQTNEADLNKNLNLLNEVLTVFQNKKDIAKQNTKSVLQKDAIVSTDMILAPKLEISKVFQFSTDNPLTDRNDKSTIITSHEDIIRSQYSLDVTKRKSSSIPQMKLEELKNSVREKTRSKDAVEEVNRMFANAIRKRHDDQEHLNRPIVSHGPRVLPVIKKEERASYSIDNILSPCKFCRSDDFSSGDSFLRAPDCSDHCNHKGQSDKTDNCVYMMCCHYKNCRKLQTGLVYCKCCGDEANFRPDRGRSNNPDNNA